jgi:hypothetical protein
MLLAREIPLIHEVLPVLGRRWDHVPPIVRKYSINSLEDVEARTFQSLRSTSRQVMEPVR